MCMNWKIELTFSPIKSVLMHKQSMMGGREVMQQNLDLNLKTYPEN